MDKLKYLCIILFLILIYNFWWVFYKNNITISEKVKYTSVNYDGIKVTLLLNPPDYISYWYVSKNSENPPIQEWVIKKAFNLK